MTGAVPAGRDDDHVFITRVDPGGGTGPTLAVKDCIDIAGLPTTAGSAVVAASAEPATADAACLAGFRAGGVRIVGKTNLHELCSGATGINPHFGTPRNPLDPRRIPGGSSSGSAVAVATGQADLALGTDTAGSIRNPAACCGVVGLKTTQDRIPVEGTRPCAPSMDTIGPLAPDVAGVAAAMAMLDDGFTPDDITADRVGLGRFTALDTDPRIDAAIDAALQVAGIGAEPVPIPGWAEAHQNGLDLMYAESLEVNRDLVEHHARRLAPDVRARFARATRLTPERISAVRERRAAWRDELVAAIDGHDALVLPGLPIFPPLRRDLDPASNVAAVAVSYAGFCAIVVPVPTLAGPPTVTGAPYPASLQLVGPPGAEERIVAIAACIEAAVVPDG